MIEKQICRCLLLGMALIAVFIIPLTAADSNFADITGSALKAHMRKITHYSLLSRANGDVLWGRIAGTRYDKMTADYIHRQFDAIGLDKVWQEEVPIVEPQWTPTRAELVLIGESSAAAPPQDAQFLTAMSSVDALAGTPESGIEAEIIDIGHGTPGELKGIDLENKIVLVHRDAPWSLFSQYTRDVEATAFIKQGKALGAVFAIHRTIPTNSKVAFWNGPRARNLPHVNIGSDDGNFLQKIIHDSGADSPPRVRLTVRGTIEKDLKSQSIFGLIHGMNRDEYVVVIAHTDGYFEGAVDNASGLSIMLELARHFAGLPREQIKRNILFIATAGHHSGPAAGTRHLAKTHRDILDKTVILLNVEHLGSIAPAMSDGSGERFEETEHLVYDTHSHPFINAVVQKAAKQYGFPVNPTSIPRYIADTGAFPSIGLPCVTIIQRAYWYHTDGDTLETVSVTGLEHAAKTIAQVLTAINNATTMEIRNGWQPPGNSRGSGRLLGAAAIMNRPDGFQEKLNSVQKYRDSNAYNGENMIENSTKNTAENISALAEEAYIFAFPMLENYKTMERAMGANVPERSRRPFNAFLHTRRLLGPEFKNIVAPNNDTLYSSAWLDLAREPLVLSVPAIPDKRYYVFQMVSMYNYNFGYVGARTTGYEAGNYLIAGPDWSGDAPNGIRKVFRSETRFVFLLARTLIDGPEDLENVKAIQDKYLLQPLSRYLGGADSAEPPRPEFEPYDADKASSSDFISYLNFILGNAAIHPDDRETIEKFSPLGIGPGKVFSSSDLPPETVAAINRGITAAMERIKAKGQDLGININGWNTMAGCHGSREILGKRPLVNAAGALIGLYGNDEEEASNFASFIDADGDTFDGSKYNYILRFEKDNLPPVKAFWSITMYRPPEMLMVENPINRYSIGDRTQGLKFDEDGSLTIYLQHESPGTEKESNWLPSPDGPFAMALRIFWPDEARFPSFAPPGVKKMTDPSS